MRSPQPVDNLRKVPQAAKRTDSWASNEGVRRSMRSNRSRNTGPEKLLRSALHRAGLRFRIHRRPMTGVRCEVDILFSAARLAVFIDGCFWHGCPAHATRPALNAEWWATKLDGNIQRDRANDALLAQAGWHVLRFWEHEAPEMVVGQIRAELAVLKTHSGRR